MWLPLAANYLDLWVFVLFGMKSLHIVVVMRNASLLSAYSLQANQHNVSFKETCKIWPPLPANFNFTAKELRVRLLL